MCLVHLCFVAVSVLLPSNQFLAMPQEIEYSEKYNDDEFEYRYDRGAQMLQGGRGGDPCRVCCPLSWFFVLSAAFDCVMTLSCCG